MCAKPGPASWGEEAAKPFWARVKELTSSRWGGNGVPSVITVEVKSAKEHQILDVSVAEGWLRCGIGLLERVDGA